ncbi:MAG: DUF433 domain-containing protein [Acidobacteria bacterium]|nr:DUF433 domain-containing protein [Acidobacteriota bacterium]
MGGVACIRGLRIPVATVVEMLAEGRKIGKLGFQVQTRPRVSIEFDR